jgi:hypothetical protein
MPKDALGHGSNPRGTHSAGIVSIPKTVKLHPDVINQIRQNPGGFSLRPNTGRAPDKGFMVSLPGRTKMVRESDLSGPHGQRIISSFVSQHADVLRKPGAHIGGWTDKASGITHLDISHNIKNRNSAVRAGVKRNQIAIWDVRKGREIKTGGSGG